MSETTTEAPLNFAQQMAAATKPRNNIGKPEPVSGSLVDTPINIPDLPVGGQIQAAPVPVETPVAPAAVRIGDKTFASVQEAIAFAEKNLAKSEGMQEVLAKMNQPAVTAEPPKPGFEKELATRFFTEPEKAIIELYEKAKLDAKKEVFDEYNDLQTKQKAEAERQANWNKVWDNFYGDNKDLAVTKDAVNFVTEKHWAAIKDMPTEQSFKIIAAETRKMLGIAKQNSLPQTALQSGPAIMPGATGTPFAAPSAATQQTPVDFVSQLKKHQKRGKQ